MTSYVITAFSRLARARVEVSRPMGVDAARCALEKMIRDAASSKGARAYIHPKMERTKPIQLTLNFKEE